MLNSIPYSSKLDLLSKFDVEQVVQKAMTNDVRKAMDQGAYDQFNLTPLRVVPVGGTSTSAVTLTTNGTVTGTASVALNVGHVKAISDLMLERNIPPFVADDYVSVAHPSTYRGFKNQLEAIHQYTPEGLRMILNGEIGRYEAFRFVQQTNIAKAGWTSTNQAFFFGQDTVAEIVVVPEEVRLGIPTDLGRSKTLGWYYLGSISSPFVAEAANDNGVNSGKLLAA